MDNTSLWCRRRRFGEPCWMDAELHRLLERNQVISCPADSPMRGRVARAVAAGGLVRLLPSVYAVAGSEDLLDVRRAAALAWRPDAVIVGDAAAQLTFWPDLPVTSVEVACPRAWRQSWPGYSIRRASVPRLWVGQGRVANPIWAALDLIPRHGAEAYYALRRSGWVEPAAVDRALAAHHGRTGSPAMRAVVKANAWSEAEARAHVLLREAGVKGWKANPEIWVSGRRYFPDLLFRRRRVAVEVEGLAYHGAPKEFGDMLRRSRELTLAGYTVLHFTWHDIVATPKRTVAQVRAALGQRG
ncbi:hypothetical protein CGZ92_08685 [Parenemella sanctibonifatiensis]|uniref:DUF559 domain-containing protein n=2 Tax=Parenemella sanctibonifatiensis TaxID=2016505 RepID=A0A255E4C1_9ACTN|nr:hypothetical protein CGZ92_08685 [Parenemella sanctibonifatiensis]